MNSRFADTLEILNGGETLDACGPVTWDPGDEGAYLQLIVQQMTTVAHGSLVISPSTVPSGGMWEVDIDSGGVKKFEPGAATGMVTAVVERADGGRRTLHWAQPLELSAG